MNKMYSNYLIYIYTINTQKEVTVLGSSSK